MYHVRANDSAAGFDQVQYQLLTHLPNSQITGRGYISSEVSSSEGKQPRLGIWLFSAIAARSGCHSHS